MHDRLQSSVVVLVWRRPSLASRFCKHVRVECTLQNLGTKFIDGRELSKYDFVVHSEYRIVSTRWVRVPARQQLTPSVDSAALNAASGVDGPSGPEPIFRTIELITTSCVV
jgi:hypothetical protein